MLYGAGRYQYELVDEWAKLPEGWSFRDVAGIAIDKQDRVYVLNRSEHPIIVLDRDGTSIVLGVRDFSSELTAAALVQMSLSIALMMQAMS